MSEPWVDKTRARLAFSRAAASYDAVACLQREVGKRMLRRLELVRKKPDRVLDLGAGTGELSAALMQTYPDTKVFALDFALPMLHLAKKRGRWLRRPSCVCADMELLPIASNSMGMVFSNLALQWANDVRKLFDECLRVLRPGGLLMFSTFGPDTLKELRSAWGQVDDLAHVSQFIDMHDLGDLLLNAGFAEPVMDVDRLTLTYQNVDGLMQDLKGLGAHNAHSGSNKGLTGKGRMAAMRAAYEGFRRDGLLPATYEVVYGHAWKIEHSVSEQRIGLQVSRGKLG